MSPTKISQLKLFLRKPDYTFLWLNHTLACKIAAFNGHILKVHIHIDKKTFSQKKFTYIFLHNLVPRDI